MKKAVQIFTSEQFGEIRTAGTWDNPLFCLADVCRALELDVNNVVRRLEDEVCSKHPITDSLGRSQNANFVNEDGLYDVVLDSRKLEAKKFRKWITSEVLPSIRKTGEYRTSQEIIAPAQIKLSDIVLDVSATKDAIQKLFGGIKDGIAIAKALNMTGKFYQQDLSELKEFLPPAEHETGYMNATQLGEKVGKSARTTNKWLADNGYQFKDGRDWRLTEKGKQYAEELPYSDRGHSGYQIKWASQIVTFLLEDSVQQGGF